MFNRKLRKPPPSNTPKKPKSSLCTDYLCSRCHLRIKSGKYSNKHLERVIVEGRIVYNLIELNTMPTKSPLDHWCFRCIANAPPSERNRKTSKGELRKLKAEQEAAKLKKQKLLEAAQAEKLRKQQEALTSKPAAQPRKKKGINEPFTLNLVYENSTRTPAEIEAIVDEPNEYEIELQKLAETTDKTIFEEDLEREDGDND